MPKSAKSDSFWRSRMTEYASGRFKFGRGQRPPPSSKWAAVIIQIDKCPLTGCTSTRDVLGRTVTCTCTYHQVKSSIANVEASSVVPRPPAETNEPPSVVEACPGVPQQPSVLKEASVVLPSPAKHEPTAAFEKASSVVEAFPVVPQPLLVSTHTPSVVHCFPADPKPTSAFEKISVVAEVSPVVAASLAVAKPPTTPSEASTSIVPVRTDADAQKYCLSSQQESSERRSDFSARLPNGWKDTIHPNDTAWLGQCLFSSKGVLVSKLKLWWYPPSAPGPECKNTPVAASYFLRRLFLWMPRKMWAFLYKCPVCPNKTVALTSKGLYNRVRSVIDLKDRYYLAAEYLECPSCKGTFIAYDSRLQQQLPYALRIRFPIVLTRKFACDHSIIPLMRARTEGNSPTAVCNDVRELHTEEWMRNTIAYLSDCERHKKGRVIMLLPSVIYGNPPSFITPPNPKWFLAIYVRDVWSRLEALKASATSVTGTILKIDSTKKITKKLQGKAANSASWCTNVGNERGEILVSLLTTSESLSNLDHMAVGLMERFSKIGQPHPLVLYTDRDCCKQNEKSKFQRLFKDWDKLLVRLDCWHFMRRISKACTSESHPLYGTFMRRLSSTIFEWDSDDMISLQNAKRSELQLAGVRIPSTGAITKAITKLELAQHCRRKTRGAENTTRLIDHMLLSLMDVTDTLGVPLLRDDALEVWNSEKKHVACLQDPEGIQLYTKVGELVKGNVTLPVYRCARGTTSLESFHRHLKSFIPGTSANDMHFQAYLIDGICRWNAARSSSAVNNPSMKTLRSFDVQLKDRLNSLSSSVLGQPIDSNYRPPSVYTGELFGIEYLYHESGTIPQISDIDKEIEEGMDGIENFYPESPISIEKEMDPELELACSAMTVKTKPEADNVLPESTVDDSQQAIDYRSIEGWDKVDKLAEILVQQEGLSISNEEAENIILHYDQLSQFDKAPLTFSRFVKPSHGRFGRSKGTTGHVGQEAMKRCFLSGGVPSLPPSKSRLVEAICVRLLNKITSPDREPYVSRFTLIIQKYKEIKNRIMLNPIIVDRTGLALFPINETTFSLWYKNQTRIEEVTLLLQGCNLPALDTCCAVPLPRAKDRPSQSAQSINPVIFSDPTDTTGQAIVRRRKTAEASDAGSSLIFDNKDQENIQQQESSSNFEFGSSQITENENPEFSDQPVPASASVSRTTAWRRRKQATKEATDAQQSQSNIEPDETATLLDNKNQSRTTEWRKRKAAEAGSALPKAKSIRKEYSCRNCGKPMSSEGHTQFQGSRFCPLNNPISKEEWLAEKRKTKNKNN